MSLHQWRWELNTYSWRVESYRIGIPDWRYALRKNGTLLVAHRELIQGGGLRKGILNVKFQENSRAQKNQKKF